MRSFKLQGKMRENGQSGLFHYMDDTSDRRLRFGETLCWGRYRLGLLSVTFFPFQEMVA
jgi:hypothetical protein